MCGIASVIQSERATQPPPPIRQSRLPPITREVDMDCFCNSFSAPGPLPTSPSQSRLKLQCITGNSSLLMNQKTKAASSDFDIDIEQRRPFLALRCEDIIVMNFAQMKIRDVVHGGSKSGGGGDCEKFEFNPKLPPPLSPPNCADWAMQLLKEARTELEEIECENAKREHKISRTLSGTREQLIQKLAHEREQAELMQLVKAAERNMPKGKGGIFSPRTTLQPERDDSEIKATKKAPEHPEKFSRTRAVPNPTVARDSNGEILPGAMQAHIKVLQQDLLKLVREREKSGAVKVMRRQGTTVFSMPGHCIVRLTPPMGTRQPEALSGDCTG